MEYASTASMKSDGMVRGSVASTRQTHTSSVHESALISTDRVDAIAREIENLANRLYGELPEQPSGRVAGDEYPAPGSIGEIGTQMNRLGLALTRAEEALRRLADLA